MRRIPVGLFLFSGLHRTSTAADFEMKTAAARRTFCAPTEGTEMIEAAKSFIGKDCIIYTFNSQQLIGKVKDVSGSAVIIETNGSTEAVNADFIVRLREHPVNKKGKKKSVVLD